MHHDDHDDHDGGLARDLKALTAQTNRRRILRFLAAAGVLPFLPALGCDGNSSTGDSGSGNDVTGTDAASGSCTAIPEETEGPYPGDGSNGPNALAQTGIVRSDIRPSFGTSTGTAAGIPLTIMIHLVNASGSCAALAGAAVYLWHCDRDGQYSLYGVPGENYLRGVQESDAAGTVTFTTIFPACYSGRMPHIHFEVYRSLAQATSSANKIKTSQIALPLDACNAVYATTGYSASVSNLAQTSFARDMVFGDGYSLQLAEVTGDVTSGFSATLTVAVTA